MFWNSKLIISSISSPHFHSIFKLAFDKKKNMEALPKSIMDVNLEEELDKTPFGATYGQLQNGLTYYVRCNPMPRMRAALCLAVKVGSVFEEENEQGIAHIVEHLAFSATKKYTNHDIVKFLESIGAEFGPCGNAYTNFDETVYDLFVPIDKPGILSEAISILSEFSSEIRISSEDLEKERGAVLEEYREGRNAGCRLFEASFATNMQGSKYAERFPIGLESVIRTAPAEVAQQFFKKWYNLHNMAVIAVGDFTDTESIVDIIREHFEQRSSSKPPVTQVPDIPFHKDARFLCLAEPEAAETSVEINWKMPNDERKTIRDYRDWLIEIIFLSAFNRRFTIISRRKDPPYFGCSVQEDELVRPVKAVEIYSSCKERGILEALKSVLTELARIRLHGFSEREIAIACTKIMSASESCYLDRDKFHSCTWQEDYLEHFLRNEAVLDLEFELKLDKSILPQISASEVSRYCEKLHVFKSSLIVTSEPRVTVTVEDLQNLVSETYFLEKEGKIDPWVEDFIPEEIIQVPPIPGEIVQQSDYHDIGVTELKLSNGLKVCYKCTDFQNDQITFKGYSCGGYSELPESDYLSCIFSSSIASEIGTFGYKPTVLTDMLAGKRAGVTPCVGNYTRSFFGYCSPSDLETALQLVYQLFLTRVQPEEENIKRVVHLVEDNIQARERNPYTAFRNRLTRIKYGNSYFYKPTQVTDLPKIDPTKACEYYDLCFKDPSTFIVVIVGNIDQTMIHPQILKYLGGIPKPSEPIMHFTWNDLKGLPSTPPSNIVREIVRGPMVEAQSSVHIALNIKLCKEMLMEEQWFVALLTQLLQNKLFKALRFEHGKIYGVSVKSNYGYTKPSTTSDMEGEITIDFGCDPNVSTKLVDLALDEVLRLQEHGPSEEDVSAVLEIEQRSHENSLQDNVYWRSQINNSYCSRVYSGDLGFAFQTLDNARSAARKTFSPLTAKWALQRILPYPCNQHYLSVTMVPETNRLLLLKHQLKTQLKEKYSDRLCLWMFGCLPVM